MKMQKIRRKSNFDSSWLTFEANTELKNTLST